MKLFQTKLEIPPINSTLINREHINNLLVDSTHKNLILVSSAAGSGKSTIISNWLSHLERPSFWYGLDESDNDSFQFLSYLIEGLNRHSCYEPYDLSSLLEAIQSIGSQGIVKSLVNMLLETDNELIMVFDDFHYINSHDIHQMMNLLISYLPSHIQIILITREDPPLSLAKIRVSNQLQEIRMKDLRFNDDEALDFFNDTMSVSILPKQVHQLNLRTEGWIAGLQLAALSLKDRSDTDEFISEFSGSHYYIMDYLLEEVLQKQSAEIQTFLLSTSILNEFCGSLCDAFLLTDTFVSQKLIQSLSQSNNFIIPLDNHRKWYRYHHLFKDLLYQKLTASDIDIQELHLKACHWFISDDNIMSAVSHALKGNHYKIAADLIEGIWRQMDQSLQGGSWLKLVKKLPDELIKKRPVLATGYGWALLDTGNIEKAIKWLHIAENILIDMDNNPALYHIYDQHEFNLLSASIASARAYLAAITGDLPGILKYANTALSQLPDTEFLRKGVLYMLLGFSNWGSGNLTCALDDIQRGLIDILKANSPLSSGSFYLMISELLIEQGQFSKANKTIREAINLTIEECKLPLSLASLYLSQSKIHYFHGEFDQAFEALSISLEKGTSYSLPDFEYKSSIMNGLLLMQQAKFKKAIISFESAKANYYINPIPEYVSLDSIIAYAYYKLGDMITCKSYLDDNPMFFEMDQMINIEIMNASGNYEEAIKTLDILLEKAQKQNRIRSQIDLLILKGSLLTTSKEMISEAIDLASVENYVLPFIKFSDELKSIIDDKDIPEFLHPYLIGNKQASDTITNANLQLVEPLSQRELQILTLLSNGYSNQDICDELFLALSTVKGYNREIFDKLNVKRRTEAVAKARILGLLS